MTQTIDAHTRSAAPAPHARKLFRQGAGTSEQVSIEVKYLGDWELVQPLGEGELTSSWQARPRNFSGEHPADYVVKTLRAELEDNSCAIKFIQREAYIGRCVTNSHLVSILDTHVCKAPYYIVMPFMQGQSLRAIIGGSRPGVTRSLWIARQCATALDAIHSLGWIHTDVKPENISISSTGHVTLLDLGLAQQTCREFHATGRMLAGTLAYTAPEIFTSSLAADHRSDLYSLGIMLFELLTGQRPFPGDNPADLVTAHRATTPPDIRSIAPQIPARVATLVKRLLAKEPLRRFQSASQLIHELTMLEIETFEERIPA